MARPTRRRFSTGMPRGWANRAAKAGVSKQRIQRMRRIARRGGISAVRRRTSFGSTSYRRRIRSSTPNWKRRRRNLGIKARRRR